MATLTLIDFIGDSFPIPRVVSDCYDRLEEYYGLGYYCELYEQYGYCSYFQSTLEYWCAKSCGFCGEFMRNIKELGLLGHNFAKEL